MNLQKYFIWRTFSRLAAFYPIDRVDIW